MRKDVREYFLVLEGLFEKTAVTGANGQAYQFDEAVDMSIRMIVDRAALGGKLLFIGNGASASISNHMATDFWKNAGVQAISFSDSVLLTCVSNDYGYKHVFEKPIEMFAGPQDILIAISSSGQSENILRGATAAKQKGLKIITLSGFDENNPLRKLGNINFYVPWSQYGHVEIAHLSICHCLGDVIINNKSKLTEKVECYE
ncbi:MAG: SIS domain-containing protein [Candidatus Omnitrophota bacterium]|nr:MAG: SIS domain-containing protein [Candidatus Omnitrophota bacterium]